jgi:PAS domain S-box-containing protein
MRLVQPEPDNFKPPPRAVISGAANRDAADESVSAAAFVPFPVQSTIESEERYRSLFNSIDEGFCVIEMIFDAAETPIDYQFLEVNPAFEQQTGLVSATGKRMRALVPRHEQHWFDIYGKVALTGEAIRFENSAKGLNRWYSVYALRIGPAASKRVAILFTDISHRKRIEARAEFLASLSQRLGASSAENDIIRIAVDAVCAHLNADRCYFVECFEQENRVIAGRNSLRSDSPTLEGQHELSDFGGVEWWREFSSGNFAVEDVQTHPLTRDTTAKYDAMGIRSYAVQPFRHEGAWTVALGVTDRVPRKWLPEELSILDDVVARVWPLVERARADRASRETLEQHVAERTVKMQEIITELESFSYSISHDLRAPLRAMQSYAAILASDFSEGVGAEGKEYIRRIVTAGERMDRLIQDVLVYSRVTRNEMPLERIELGSFIASILESYPQFDASHARIEVVLPLAPVRANATALTQCVSNLVGNAIKFVTPGMKPYLRIWTEVTVEQRVRLFFADNGIGIAETAREKIFGIFYQADQRYGGTGIGLAVVRKAAQRMDGSVRVESRLGEGSTFCLELKLAH